MFQRHAVVWFIVIVMAISFAVYVLPQPAGPKAGKSALHLTSDMMFIVRILPLRLEVFFSSEIGCPSQSYPTQFPSPA
jgi:hypothetical protein